MTFYTTSTKNNSNSSSMRNISLNDLYEGCVRVILLIIFLYSELKEPFVRKIQPEEIWLYRNPRTASYIPADLLWKMVALVPLSALLVFYIKTRNRMDLRAGVMTATLAIPLNGVLTNIVKLCVGRFRPDFVYRCWPDGNIPEDAFKTDELVCSGDPAVVTEGRKSFPSGHSSFSFATWGFVFLYMSGKLGTFRCRSERSSWRMLLSILLMMIPATIAMSRAADYHHHWQDVIVGSILGLATVWLVYRQYYPSLNSDVSHLPLCQIAESQCDSCGATVQQMSRISNVI